jgi:hypothetical protein
MTDYEKALKEAHKHADKAIDSVEEVAKTVKEKFKIWANKPWKTISKGEALVGAAFIILMILAAG